ncbi:helix-turn-helix domain-containing protein [Bacillus thuringiensis]|uniref:helix-turn-helix domain-containing protein n=1 Tax=Bacillus thuringiensis TaxID=1428 RepID=UPI0009B8312D
MPYTNKREVTFQTSLFQRTRNYSSYSELLKLQPYFVSRLMFFQTLQQNPVNKWCNRGKFHENEARKSGKVWLVTRNGMNRLTRK